MPRKMRHKDARRDLRQLEAQLDSKPPPKTKAARRRRAELQREIHERRGIVRDIEIAEGRRRPPTPYVAS